jgi:hypothetical protein
MDHKKRVEDSRRTRINLKTTHSNKEAIDLMQKRHSVKLNYRHCCHPSAYEAKHSIHSSEVETKTEQSGQWHHFAVRLGLPG